MGIARARPLFPLALSLVLAGCGGDAARSSGPAVRDSAGARIVENERYAWPDGRGWRLSDRPLLDIGALEEPDYQLFRVAGAVRLSDGRIVVANSGTSELRFYDASGRHLSSAGREGAGPGEFQGLWRIWALPGDTLLAYDFRLRRVSLFDPNGAFVRSFQLQPLTGGQASASVVGAFADGSLLVAARTAVFTPGARSGLRRDSTLYLRSDREGALADSLGWFPGPEWYVKADERSLSATTRAFGRQPVAAASAASFYFGSSDTYEIARYDTAGALTALIRRAYQNPPVTDADIARWIEERLENFKDASQRSFWERVYAEMPVPETMPAYEALLVDAEGNLWVEEYRRPGDERPRWTVFDPDGVMLGVVEFPERFRVYQIGADFVLGRWRDELDVEHVQLYELIKP
jgi:hypothetical protein